MARELIEDEAIAVLAPTVTTRDARSQRAAACYTGTRTLAVLEREPRPPASGEVEIAVAYTGICDDLHISRGHGYRVTVPAVLGHGCPARFPRSGRA